MDICRLWEYGSAHLNKALSVLWMGTIIWRCLLFTDNWDDLICWRVFYCNLLICPLDNLEVGILVFLNMGFTFIYFYVNALYFCNWSSKWSQLNLQKQLQHQTYIQYKCLVSNNNTEWRYCTVCTVDVFLKVKSSVSLEGQVSLEKCEISWDVS